VQCVAAKGGQKTSGGGRKHGQSSAQAKRGTAMYQDEAGAPGFIVQTRGAEWNLKQPASEVLQTRWRGEEWAATSYTAKV